MSRVSMVERRNSQRGGVGLKKVWMKIDSWGEGIKAGDKRDHVLSLSHFFIRVFSVTNASAKRTKLNEDKKVFVFIDLISFHGFRFLRIFLFCTFLSSLSWMRYTKPRLGLTFLFSTSLPLNLISHLLTFYHYCLYPIYNFCFVNYYFFILFS